MKKKCIQCGKRFETLDKRITLCEDCYEDLEADEQSDWEAEQEEEIKRTEERVSSTDIGISTTLYEETDILYSTDWEVSVDA